MKYRSIVITVLLVLSPLCVLPLLADEVVEKGYHYEINKENKTATLIRYTGTSSNVNIPNCIKCNGMEYFVTEVHSRAFSESQIKKKIKKIRIGNSIRCIRDNTFEGCVSLVSVDFGKSVSTIGYSAFYGCNSLVSISIPSSVTIIGNYAFADCTSLNHIDIGENVTTIGNKAFHSCLSITTLVLPKSITSIGYEAFAGCNKLKTITFHAEKVPITDISAFNYVNQQNVILKVPDLSIGDYKKYAPWKDFGTIIDNRSLSEKQ